MYVSPKILKELSQNYKTIQPELGKEKEVTILFSDIRNFTSLTKQRLLTKSFHYSMNTLMP